MAAPQRRPAFPFPLSNKPRFPRPAYCSIQEKLQSGQDQVVPPPSRPEAMQPEGK